MKKNVHMDITTISAFRKQTKKYFDEVHRDHTPVLLTRSDGATVVIIPFEQFTPFSETDYLVDNPFDAARLRQALADAQAGKVTKRKLADT
jgi:antitoxin YefM